jgi:translation elongation factor EF-4
MEKREMALWRCWLHYGYKKCAEVGDNFTTAQPGQMKRIDGFEDVKSMVFAGIG